MDPKCGGVGDEDGAEAGGRGAGVVDVGDDGEAGVGGSAWGGGYAALGLGCDVVVGVWVSPLHSQADGQCQSDGGNSAVRAYDLEVGGKGTTGEQFLAVMANHNGGWGVGADAASLCREVAKAV